jgi:hypothetical protein
MNNEYDIDDSDAIFMLPVWQKTTEPRRKK